MINKFLIIILCFASACNYESIKKEQVELNVDLKKLNAEVLDIDSMLINGKHSLVLTLDSAIEVFGDTLLSYLDYRYPYYEHSSLRHDIPVRVYVFHNIILREWIENKVILMHFNFKTDSFITFKGDTINRASGKNYLKNNFGLSVITALDDRIYGDSINKPDSYFIDIRASNNSYYFDDAIWRFYILGDKISSLELFNFNQ